MKDTSNVKVPLDINWMYSLKIDEANVVRKGRHLEVMVTVKMRLWLKVVITLLVVGSSFFGYGDIFADLGKRLLRRKGLRIKEFRYDL